MQFSRLPKPLQALRSALVRWGRAYWARAMARGARLGTYEIPRDREAAERHLREAIELAEQRDLGAAEAAVREALVNDLGDGEAHLLLARLLAARGAFDEAPQSFEQAALRSPMPSAVYFEAGQRLRRGGDHVNALRFLLRATDLAPAMADAHAELGDLYTCRGDLDAAVRSLRAAIAVDPEHEAARQALARLG